MKTERKNGENRIQVVEPHPWHISEYLEEYFYLRSFYRIFSYCFEHYLGGEWISFGMVLVGLGAFALATFWIRKCRQSSQTKHEYSAVKTDGPNEQFKNENKIRNGAYLICKRNLEDNDRYELTSQLGDIGSRPDKHWFTVQDRILGAERLLTLVPLPSTCPFAPSNKTRELLLELFRGLQHPYIHPVLDIDFWDAGVSLVSPLNPTGSLRDIIYSTSWRDDYDKKYVSRGEGLPLRTVQCLGRQILEALLFLRNRQFPSIYHLHSGNVIIQNGVARLAGLENSLLGLLPRAPSAPESLALGYLLFEMSVGYELSGPPSPAHLQLELERAPLVADALEIIFQNTRTPNLEDVARCDLFRGVELRELRGTSIVQVTTPPEVLELLYCVRNPVLPSPLLRRFSWPDALNCSRFPVENNHEHMCMEGPKDKIDIRAPVDPAVRKTECGSRGFRGQSGGCVSLGCDGNGGVFDETEKRIAEVWIMVCALTCLTSSLSSALTLTLGGGKVRALPLIVLALCYCLIGAGWTLRSFAGRAGGSCGTQEPRDSEDGLGNVNCAFVFLMLYYFGMAANAWWVCLCIWWVTRAGLCWSPEKMRSLTTVLHVCAWGFPAAQTVTALVRRDVDSDELTGTCYIGNKSTSTLLYLVLLPYMFYFCIGVLFLIFGWTLVLRKPKVPSVSSVNVPLTNSVAAPRKERDFLGAICILYAVPTLCVMATYYYEYRYRESWLSGTRKPALWAFLLRHFMSLCIGISSIFWIWSHKSTQAWKSALKRLGPRKQPLKTPPVLRYPMHHQTLSHMGSVTTSLNSGVVRQSSRAHQHRKVPRSHHLRSGSETVI